MNSTSFSSGFLDELAKLSGWQEDWAASTEKHRKGFSEALDALLKRKVAKMSASVHARMGTGSAKPAVSLLKRFKFAG
jgi:hypothetical protein